MNKYDVNDYFQIDEAFGDNDTFKKLVSEAHKRGLKIMLDAVFNHVGREFSAFKDVQKHLKKSKF